MLARSEANCFEQKYRIVLGFQFAGGWFGHDAILPETCRINDALKCFVGTMGGSGPAISLSVNRRLLCSEIEAQRASPRLSGSPIL